MILFEASTINILLALALGLASVTPSCGITFKYCPDNSRDIIYHCNIFIVQATVIFLLHINSKINKLLCLRSHHSFANGGSSVAEPFTINSAIGGSNPVAHSAMGEYDRERNVSYHSKAAAFAVSTDDYILLRFSIIKF
jgi:hypothetical protein